MLKKIPYKHTTCIPRLFPRRFNVEYTWCVCRVMTKNGDIDRIYFKVLKFQDLLL